MTSLLLLIHFVGTALGVGGATASDMLFLRTVRNRLISRDQFILIRTVSRTVMGGMVLVVLSGAGLMLDEYFRTGAMETLGQAHFQAKLLIVVVLLVNGIIFHSVVFGFLKVHVDERMTEEKVGGRLLVLAGSGAGSIVSWYGVLVLAALGPLPLSLPLIVGIYVVMLGGAATGAYLVLSHLFSGPVEHTVGHVGGSSKKLTMSILVALILVVAGVVAYGVS